MTETPRWDMHVHSCYSWDGHPNSTIEALGTAAEQLGLTGIAITDHVDCPCAQEDQREVGRADLAARARDLEQVRRRSAVAILSAVELGEPHLKSDEANELRHQYELNFVLGSVHSVVYRHARMPVESLTGHLEPATVMNYYFDEVLQMLDTRPNIDALGHLAYPLRSAATLPALTPGLIAKLRDIVQNTTSQGIAIEVNARDPQRFYDMMWDAVPELATATVSIGSDAHQLDRIEDDNVSSVRKTLSRGGFGPHPTRPGLLWATRSGGR